MLPWTLELSDAQSLWMRAEAQSYELQKIVLSLRHGPSCTGEQLMTLPPALGASDMQGAAHAGR